MRKSLIHSCKHTCYMHFIQKTTTRTARRQAERYKDTGRTLLLGCKFSGRTYVKYRSIFIKNSGTSFLINYYEHCRSECRGCGLPLQCCSSDTTPIAIHQLRTNFALNEAQHSISSMISPIDCSCVYSLKIVDTTIQDLFHVTATS